MDNTYKLTISTPDGNVFEGEVYALFLRGAKGDIAVLARHIPFVTTVCKGKCRIEFIDGSEKAGFTDGGILNVAKDGTTLLSSSFTWE